MNASLRPNTADEPQSLSLSEPRLLRHQSYIDGLWVDGPASIEVTNPATGRSLGSIPDLGEAETLKAVEAAKKALPAWRARMVEDRGAVLRRWFDLMRLHQEDLARILTAEQGKPLA